MQCEFTHEKTANKQGCLFLTSPRAARQYPDLPCGQQSFCRGSRMCRGTGKADVRICEDNVLGKLSDARHAAPLWESQGENSLESAQVAKQFSVTCSIML